MLPLIEKAMKQKGYSRIEATERAEKWMAGELGVDSLYNLNFIDAWTAEAIVERALLPPMKKVKKKMEIPAELKAYVASEPLGSAYWNELKAEWGEQFFNWYFGEMGESSALLSPGQTAQKDFSKMELILA